MIVLSRSLPFSQSVSEPFNQGSPYPEPYAPRPPGTEICAAAADGGEERPGVRQEVAHGRVALVFRTERGRAYSSQADLCIGTLVRSPVDRMMTICETNINRNHDTVRIDMMIGVRRSKLRHTG